MRIIAGTHRGRKLLSVPKSLEVKPISDRMKQSLFDILRPIVTGSLFLDLFAGTGAVGLEALSRNAMKVVFVDKHPVCLKTIKRNIEKFLFQDRTSVRKADILSDLSWLNRYTDEQGYDIIFMGPPYRTEGNKMLNLSGKVIENIFKAKILAEKGIIVCQHHKTELFDVPEGLTLYRAEKYGDTLIDFIKRTKYV